MCMPVVSMFLNPVSIHVAQRHEIEELVNFVMQARARMFPMLDPAVMPVDLLGFDNTYLTGAGGCFLMARHGDALVGVIGFVPYDGRFSQLDYGTQKVVEVVRLFISPDSRRLGVARQLFEALKTVAVERAVDVLYLHTHPFLAGAIEFWERQGFVIVDTEADPIWHTTHMQLTIGTTDGSSGKNER